MRQTERGGTERTGQLGAFLLALALLLVLTVFAHRVVLGLAAVIAGPLPAARTALSLSRKAMQETVPDETPGSIASEPAPESAPEAAAPANTGMESYLAALEADDARPADAGAVQEKTYPHGSGEKYIPCGGGSIKNNTRVQAAEVAAEITNPLPFAVEWNSPDPQILIMHTHATESFEPYDSEIYDTRHTWRSTDNSENIVAAGEVMAQAIRSHGIEVLHDDTQHDYPSYNGSYERSAETVKEYLAKYPSIKVVLDVHRDAVQRDSTLVKPVTQINGKKAAQMMIIAGCDDGTMEMPNWGKNLRFAAGIQDAIESRWQGLTRPIFFCYRKYNQDLTTGSLLLELGSHGNTLEQVLTTAQLAGDAIGNYLAQECMAE